jgi:hypothetical protein
MFGKTKIEMAEPEPDTGEPRFVEIGIALRELALDPEQFRADCENGFIPRPKCLSLPGGMGRSLDVAGEDTLTCSLALTAWRADKPRYKQWAEMSMMAGHSGPPSLADFRERPDLLPEGELSRIKAKVAALLSEHGLTKQGHREQMTRAWAQGERDWQEKRRLDAERRTRACAARDIDKSLKAAALGALTLGLPVKELKDRAAKALAEVADAEAKQREKDRLFRERVLQPMKGAEQ